MFKSLPSVIHQEIASKLTVQYYKEGETSNDYPFAMGIYEILIVCKQGQEGDCLYVIYDGTVKRSDFSSSL